MDVRTAVVTLMVAAIGAAAGFIGGFLSARWQARNDLAQWRRDRLLTFCSDLVAAGRELIFKNWKPGDEYPIETTQRLDLAYACVLLLGENELDDRASDFEDAVLDVLLANMAPVRDPQERERMLKFANASQAAFLLQAHDLLLGTLPKPSLSSRLWLRLRRFSKRTTAGQLEVLTALREKGALTEEELAALKAKLPSKHH